MGKSRKLKRGIVSGLLFISAMTVGFVSTELVIAVL